MLPRRVEHRVGVEPREQHRGAAAEQGAVQPDAEAVDVEQRERQHQAVVLVPAPGQPQRLAARQRVAVGEHGALRRAGGARRVAEERQVVGSARGRARARVRRPGSTRPGRRRARGRARARARSHPAASESTTAAAGSQSVTMAPISRARYARLTGTTTSPSRSAATCATTRSYDVAALITTRSPGPRPARAKRPAAARDLRSRSPAVCQRPPSCTTGRLGLGRPAAAPRRGQAAAGEEVDGRRVDPGREVARPGRVHRRRGYRDRRGPRLRLPRMAGEHDRSPAGLVPFWAHQLAEMLLGGLLLVEGARTGQHTAVLVGMGGAAAAPGADERRRARGAGPGSAAGSTGCSTSSPPRRWRSARSCCPSTPSSPS